MPIPSPVSTFSPARAGEPPEPEVQPPPEPQPEIEPDDTPEEMPPIDPDGDDEIRDAGRRR